MTATEPNKDPWEVVAEMRATIIGQERALVTAHEALAGARVQLTAAKAALDAVPHDVAAAVAIAFAHRPPDDVVVLNPQPDLLSASWPPSHAPWEMR